MKHRLLPIYSVIMILCAGFSHASELDEIRARNLEKTNAWFTETQIAAATNSHWHVLPRILVDTQQHAILFKAEATGLSPRDIVEFFLIGERSGNAYEAIAVALAEPGDIATAIKMLGLSPGLHADPAALRFWPQGERVHIYLDEQYATDLMIDQRSGQTPPRAGFVFTANHTTARQGKPKLSAQTEPPFSIAANYNEPRSILDVPFRAPQSAVYSHQVQNPQIQFEPGQLLTVRIEPERTDGTKRVQPLQLKVSHTESATTAPATELRFTLAHTNAPNAPLLEKASIETFLMYIRGMIEAQTDPFVEIHYSDTLTLLHAHNLARIIEAMEDNDGLRVLPPPPATLFYRAFAPNEEQRERADRFAHPWELQLSHAEDPLLIQIIEEWIQGEPRPNISINKIPVPDPEQLAAQMTARRPDLKAVYIYAPRNMQLGTIMGVVQHFQQTHPLVHVFMSPPPRDQTSGEAPATTSE